MWEKGGVAKLPDKARTLAQDALLALLIAGYMLLCLGVTQAVHWALSRL